MRKKSLVKLIGCVCLVLVLVIPLSLAACGPAQPEGPITLKVLRPWPYDSKDLIGYREYINRVNAKAPGELVLEDIGGSEVYPSREQLEPLKLGSVDILLTSAGYIADAFPEPVSLMYVFGASHAEARKAGLIKTLNKIAKEEHGLTLLGMPWYGSAILYLTKPITSLSDLTTLKIRSHPAYDPVIKGLGAATVSVGFGDVFTALDRGTIDGIMWVPWDLVTYGLEEAITHRVDPPFLRAGWSPMLMNAARFEALSGKHRAILTDTMEEVENDFENIAAGPMAEEWAQLRAAGIQDIDLSNADWLMIQEVAWTEFQKIISEVSPDHAADLIKILSKLYPPSQQYATPD